MIKQAYSLIEVLVALFLLMFGMMGLALAFQRSVYSMNSARNDSVAMMICSGIIDELEARPFDSWSSQAALDTIAEQFVTSYKGEMVPAGSSEAFFSPEIVIKDDYVTHRRLEIIVNWTGWSEEMTRGGFVDTTASDAFVMEAIIAQTYGADLIGGSGATGG
jgi:Tfp pilus assembly protein PilV